MTRKLPTRLETLFERPRKLIRWLSIELLSIPQPLLRIIQHVALSANVTETPAPHGISGWRGGEDR